MHKDNTVNNAKIKINSVDWYVPHYTPSINQPAILFKQIQSKTPTELQYPVRSILMKEVNTQSIWNFELGTQEGINVPIRIFVIFNQSDREHDQNLNNDTSYRMPVTSAQCIIGTEKHTDSSIMVNHNDDEDSQGYGQIKEVFKALRKDGILQPYKSEHDFRSSNDGNNDGYNIHVFDIRYQKNF